MNILLMLIYYKLLLSHGYVQILLTTMHFVIKAPNSVDISNIMQEPISLRGCFETDCHL